MNTAICLDRDGVLQALHDVSDPELGYNIVDLGLIYELQVDGGVVEITMTMTTPGCPAQDYILSGVIRRGDQAGRNVRWIFASLTPGRLLQRS